MRVTSKSYITYCKLAAALAAAALAASTAGAASATVATATVATATVATATVAVTVVDKVGSSKTDLSIQFINSSGVSVTQITNTSSSVIKIKEGSYTVRLKCGKDDFKDTHVSLLHDCGSDEPAGSLCQGSTAIVPLSCS